jgi:hypothetical protein
LLFIAIACQSEMSETSCPRTTCSEVSLSATKMKTRLDSWNRFKSSLTVDFFKSFHATFQRTRCIDVVAGRWQICSSSSWLLFSLFSFQNPDQSYRWSIIIIYNSLFIIIYNSVQTEKRILY